MRLPFRVIVSSRMHSYGYVIARSTPRSGGALSHKETPIATFLGTLCQTHSAQ